MICSPRPKGLQMSNFSRLLKRLLLVWLFLIFSLATLTAATTFSLCLYGFVALIWAHALWTS